MVAGARCRITLLAAEAGAPALGPSVGKPSASSLADVASTSKSTKPWVQEPPAKVVERELGATVRSASPNGALPVISMTCGRYSSKLPSSSAQYGRAV